MYLIGKEICTITKIIKLNRYTECFRSFFTGCSWIKVSAQMTGFVLFHFSRVYHSEGINMDNYAKFSI